jgi:hypothetical protein
LLARGGAKGNSYDILNVAVIFVKRRVGGLLRAQVAAVNYFLSDS